MPATPCNVHGQNANQPTTYQDAGQGLAFNPWGSVPRGTAGERGVDEEQRTQGKPKRTRRSSASPLPPTPTKLRASIKPTEKGQHLTKAFEHRKILHEQLRLEASRAQESKAPGVSVKEEVAAREATPMQQVVASAVPAQTSDTFLPFEESDKLHTHVIYRHPTLGWGWMPSSNIPISTQGHETGCGESDVFDQPLPSGSGQQATLQPSKSFYGLSAGGTLLASPFQPQPKSSVLPKQGSDNLGLQAQHHSVESGLQSFGDRVSNALPIISLARGDDTPSTPDFHTRIEASPGARSDAETTSRPLRAVAEYTSSPDVVEDPQSLSSDANTLNRRDAVQLAADRSSPVPSQSSRPPKTKSNETMGTPSDEPVPWSTDFAGANTSSQVGLQRPCAVDFFLLYRHYFLNQIEEELRRIPNEKFDSANKQDIPDSVVKKAYELFKTDIPEYETFLLDSWSIDRMMSSRRNSNGRSDLFDKYVIKLKNIYRFASTLLHFETASCIAGREIHKDQALSASVCSPMVPNFFADRLRVSESDITGHLQAYAYDYVSKQTIPNILRAGPDQQDGYTGTSVTSIGSRSAKNEPDASTSKVASDRQIEATSLIESTPTLEDPVEETGDSEKKKKPANKKDQDRLRELKRLLFILTEHCDIKQLSTAKAIQLTKLPQILAARGWIIENWPEDLPFACDCKTGKGVAGLSAQEQIALLKALRDPRFPIRVVKKYETSVPISEPAIIGVPPPPDSIYTHGRRRFLNPENTSDRKGPLRLGLLQDGQSSEKSTDARASLATPDTAHNPLPKRPLVDEGLSADERWSKKSKRVTFLEDTPERDSVIRNQSSQFFRDGPVLDSALDANKRELGLKCLQAQVPGSILRPEDDNVPRCSAGSDEHGRRYTAEEGTRLQGFNLAKQSAEGGPSVPAVTVNSEPCKSGIDAAQSPGSYWLSFQQPGQYPLSLPPGAQFMPSHIPFFAVPTADGHGPNLHRSGPPFIPYQASQASSSQLVEAKFLLPAQAPVPPVMPNSSPSQTYTGDALGYHLQYDAQNKSIQDMTPLAPARSNSTDG